MYQKLQLYQKQVKTKGGLRWFISPKYRERDKETGKFIKLTHLSKRTPRDRTSQTHVIYMGLEVMNHMEKALEDLYKQHAN